ncbi:MAG: zinc ribbon domain-containing protein [bacterium]|nr:zinc ribbon domain-containing protein [bacterium]
MPTYEYKCDDCGHQFDALQSMKDEKLTKCPNCGKETLRRLIGTGGGLIFKGSGFYLTDYKNKSAEKTPTNNSGSDKSKGEPAPAKEKSTTESKPSSTTESKPSEKKEAKPKTDKS